MDNAYSAAKKLQHEQNKKTGSSAYYVGVMTGLFNKKHLDQMGNAIFTYGLLLSKVTGWDKRFALGAVLKGTPIKIDFLESESGIPGRTIRRHMLTLETHGYIIKLRSARGLRIYITNYRPAGKPRLASGECPQAAVLRLSNLADQGILRGQRVATLVGYKWYGIITETSVSNETPGDFNHPQAELFIYMQRLFGLRLGTAELRYLHRGNKHSKTFHGIQTVIQATARTLMAHEAKKEQQERKGMVPVGITNVVAYLNSGLHGPRRFLLQKRKGEYEYIKRCESLYAQIASEIKDYREKQKSEKEA
ncbi:MAG: hypothetical protein U5R06_02405 [candidate division KSB1 bacterium]|nr:hypothetical protein [candidate division KSB1 bacterium]